MTDIKALDAAATHFEREERYIVVKRKSLGVEKETSLRRFLRHQSITTIEGVVVESDWPEYETVWQMIEARVTGCAKLAPADGAAVEPVALLHEHKASGERDVMLYAHGAARLTDADKAAGWTETALFAAMGEG